MHILYLHQYFSTPEGATGTRSYHFAKEMVANGHSVTMITGSYETAVTGLEGDHFFRRGTINGIDVIEIGIEHRNSDSVLKRFWVYFAYAVCAFFLALCRPPDAIYATSTPLTVGIPALFLKKLTGAPFIFEIRDLWPKAVRQIGALSNEKILILLSRLEQIIYRSADRVVIVAPGMRQHLNDLGISSALIRFIPNGAVVSNSDNNHEVKSRLASNPDEFRIVYTGAQGRANHLVTILKIARELRASGEHGISFYLYGQGSQKPILQNLAGKWQLNNVIFHEPVAKQDLPDVFRVMDMGILVMKNIEVFQTATSPNKFFDYIAAGLPVLNTYRGWIADEIEKHQCGVTVSNNNSQMAASILKAVKPQYEMLEEMSVNARKLAITHYDIGHLAQQAVEIIEEVNHI